MLLRGSDQVAGSAPPIRPTPPPRRARPIRTLGRIAVVAMLLVGGVGLTLRGESASAPRVIARLSSPAAAGEAPLGGGPDRQRVVADALGRALSTGDASGLADVVDPAAPAVLARWRAVVQNVRTLGLTGVSYTVGTPTRGPASSGWTEVGGVGLTLSYRLPGWDPAPAQSQLWLPQGLRGSHWLISADPVPAQAAARPPATEAVDPWLLGPVTVTRTAHVMVIGDPGLAKDYQGLAGRLEAAASAVRRVVSSDRWNGRVVAYASRSPAFVSAWFGAAAATGATPVGREPATFAAEVRSQGTVSRLAVTPFLVTRTDDRSRAVLRHEVTHVALAGPGVATMATWLAEGTAEYVAYGGSPDGRVDAVGALGRRGLPQSTWWALRTAGWQPVLAERPEDFYSGSTATVGDRYTAAWLTCLYVAKTYGQATLFALYAAAAADGSRSDPASLEAAALRRVLRTDRATLSRNVAGFARTLRANFA